MSCLECEHCRVVTPINGETLEFDFKNERYKCKQGKFENRNLTFVKTSLCRGFVEDKE